MFDEVRRPSLFWNSVKPFFSKDTICSLCSKYWKLPKNKKRKRNAFLKEKNNESI